MSDNTLSINARKLVRDAFYAIPDFTDAEGNHIGGIYGALFRLKELISSGEYTSLSVEFGDSENSLTPVLNYQAVRFEEILKTAAGLVVSRDLEEEGTAPSITGPIDDDLKAAIEKALLDISPTGKAIELPKFKFTTKITSDLNEVEGLFKEAEKLAGADKFVGFYLLTERLNDKFKDRTLSGMAICFSEDLVTYIPVENFMTAEYLGGKLVELSGKVNLSTFDIKESYRFFTPVEISNRTRGYVHGDDSSGDQFPRCFDTLLAAYLNNPLKSDYEPHDISSEVLGIPMEKRSDVFGKKKLSEIEIKVLADYACKAAYTCFAAAPLLKKKMIKSGMADLFYDIEMPLSYILYSMEKEGIIARKDALSEYGARLLERITELESAIYEAAGETFNINSPKQLGEILFEKLHLPAEKKTRSGYSTAADVLEKLAPDHRIVADILEYRGLAKLKSTYADGLAAYIESDNRIHTSFNQTITATGRISSTEPNLQNIPMRTELGRLIRKVFVPKEGYLFADADYSQIELRILAHMSEDEGLINAYHEGSDIHRITASKVFHVPFDEVTPMQRRNAKAVNFGIVYGMSSFGLSQDLSISVSEARDYMEKYFDTYPGVRDYQNRAILSAKENGFSKTLYGRRRPIPELKGATFMLRQFGERVAMNAPIQGTAADIMKIAMINVFFRIKRENLKSRLILQIHDELVIETAPDEKDIVTNILVEEMGKSADLSVPLEVDCHTGSDWYEAK